MKRKADSAEDKQCMIHRHIDNESRAKWLAKREERSGKWESVFVESGDIGLKSTWHVIGVRP